MKNIVTSFKINTLSSRKGLGVGLLLLLCLSIGQMWGATWSFSGTSYMYFHNKAGWTDSGKMLFIGKDSYSSVYTMAAVSNTQLWVVQMPSSGWSDASYMAVAGGGSVWGSGSWGPSNRTNATHYTNTYTSGISTSSTQYYIFIPSSTSNNASIPLTYLGNAISSLNKTITVKAKVSTNGGISYSEATSPGTLSASSKKFTAYNSCASATSLSSGTISCGYTATTTLTAADATNYDFVGWYNSSGTQQTTSKTLTIYPTDAATYYAYYKLKQYTVSYGVCSTTRYGSITLNSGSAVTTTSSSTLNHGTAISFTASPNSGYQVEGWYSTSACAVGDRLQEGGTSYNAGTLTAAKTVYVKFKVRTGGTITLSAGANGEVSADNSSWGTTKTISDITTATDKNIYARGNTGYQFSSWTKSSGSGTIKTNAASGVFTTVAYEDATVTASFSEVMSTLSTSCHYDAGNPSYAAPTVSGSATNVGYVTTRTITATSAGTGYTFAGWTLTNCTRTDGGAATAKTITVRSNGDGAAASVVANYNEVLTQSTWIIKGGTAFGGTAWSTEHALAKQTGHSTESVVYKTFTISSTNTGESNDNFKFKVVKKGSPDAYFGLTADGSYYLMRGESGTEKTLATENADIQLRADVAGDYIFKVDYTTPASPKLTITFPTSYTLTYDIGTVKGTSGSISTSPATASGSKVLSGNSVTLTGPAAKSGYSWKGWYTDAGGTTGKITDTNRAITVTMNADKTLYACYTANSYTVTLNKQTSATGYGTSGTCGNQTVTYNATPTAITKSTLPTGSEGYGFMGFYTETAGSGLQVIDAEGHWNSNVSGYLTSGKWTHDGNVTLYAYYKKAEIVNLDINPSLTEKGGTVEVTPEIEPEPTGTTSVCYYLLYTNGNKVDPQPEFSIVSGNTVSFTAPSSAGTFIVAAALRTGSSCGGGTLLDSVATHTFQVGGVYTVTIKYMCGTEVIKEQTRQGANPVEYTSISAPDIFGYTFSTWKLGDGITKHSEDALTKKNNFRFLASYDGTITALYTKNQYIYLDLSQQFSESGYWNNPYVYFYSANPWNDTYGVGATGHSNYISGHAMTQIGSTGIWYYDYSGVSGACNYVAFTWGNKTGQDNFNYTDVIFRGDFTDGTPLFVPSTGQSKVVKNTAAYYSQGYWVKYLGEETGYRLIIYDAGGTVELKRIGFTSDDKRMTMKAVTDLEAEHTYYYEVYRDDGYYYKNNTSNITPTSRGPKNLKDGTKGTIKTSAAGDYTFTLGYTHSNGYFTISVDYPAVEGDYQFLYGDQASADYWSTGSAHSSTWRHPSRIISKTAGAKDTISFFVVKGASPTLEYRTVKSINASGVITWNAKTAISGVVDTISKTGVYNFILHQSSPAGSISIEKVEPYTGDFYIRTDAVSNKWDNYTTDPDHLMTYSAFSEDRSQNGFGELFSHYKAKWCPRGTNVKFVIANDYSPCISDTLIRDVTRSWPENMDATGKLNSDGSADVTKDRWSANIRFMWNRKTNKISRAYVAASTNVTRKFLVLRGCDTKIHDHNNYVIPATTYLAANEVLLEDDQNWIYETTIKVQPEARVKLYACYGEDPASVPNAQYFRGAYDSGSCGSSTNSIQILGGSGSTYYLMRVIYDFKTNRLITAWLPDGTPVDQAPLNIDADVMVIRDHQQAAEAITFTTNTKSLGQVKTVYGTIRFNRWTLNNRYRSSDTYNPSFVPSTTETDVDKEHSKNAEAISRYHAPLPTYLQTSSFERNNYFISFPFDVELSEVFGFGTYGTHWIISKYNGLRRAQVGYFRDNCINGDFDCTNWDYIWDRTGVTLKAYEGYLLSLDLDLMQYDDTTNFWLNQIHQVELYFPSKVPMGSITTTNVTLPALGNEYLCTKNYNTDGTNPEGDRRVKDSYWRCIGVPSYAPYGTVLKTGETEIQWNSDYTWYEDQRSFPFLYEWNTTDNTLTPQRTKTFNFKPLHSYLVQNKNTITWTAVSATPAAPVAARMHDEDVKELTWRLTLTGNADDESDTYIRMTNDEDVTPGFDFGPDLIKKFRDGYILDEKGDPIWDSSIDDYKQGVLHSDIYSLIGYEYLAANSLPFNTTSNTIVPIGVRTKVAGDFTFAMPDGTHGVGITLVDQVNGIRTNLSTGLSYTTALEKGQFDKRFYLEISPVQQTPTGIEPTTDSSLKGREVRKVLIDGVLYIVRDGKIFDARGARVE